MQIYIVDYLVENGEKKSLVVAANSAGFAKLVARDHTGGAEILPEVLCVGTAHVQLQRVIL